MPNGHQHFFERQGWTPAYFLNQAILIGPAVQLYMDEVLKAKVFTEQTYNACRGLLRLNKDYGSARLQAACSRALGGNVFNYSTIHNILISNQDQLPQTNQQDIFRVPDHPNLRGPDAYQ